MKAPEGLTAPYFSASTEATMPIRICITIDPAVRPDQPFEVALQVSHVQDFV